MMSVVGMMSVIEQVSKGNRERMHHPHSRVSPEITIIYNIFLAGQCSHDGRPIS